MPFTNAHHGGDEPFDLGTRINAEIRLRIEDAVDFVCLGQMVRAREASRAPAPAADDPRDRDEYGRRVAAFLDALRVEIVASLSDEQRSRLAGLLEPAPRTVETSLRVQVALAKELPDYWQRFDSIRLQVPDADPRSRGQGLGLLDWLLRRG